MSEEVSYIPEPPESFEAVPEKKKSNNTLWIILAVVVVILLCCCLVIGLALALGFFSFAEIDPWVYQMMPYLHLI
jgi:flagellar basal body-associated protein FliL